ncbi:MAG: redoxin domain-containing protein [Clostridia bacterium]|nr:redoxin domain-containing protein [Clostridia bacterium]
MKFKRVLSIILVVLMLGTMLLQMVSCNGNNNPPVETGSGSGDTTGTQGTYTIEIKSIGGFKLKDVLVELYSDGKLASKGVRTDANGIATFKVAQKSNYVAKLSDVPAGYKVNESYPVNSTGTSIVLTSGVIEDTDTTNVTYNTGDIIHDFSVTLVDGSTWTLSEVLKEKKAVLLNFWYTTCTYCIGEFPDLENAYQQYKDKIDVIAINGNSTEDIFAVQAFVNEFKDRYYAYYPLPEGEEQEDLKLSFPIAKDNQTNPVEDPFERLYGDSWGNPVSVMIDRYGVITMIYLGALPSERHFTTLFEYYTADDYTQKLVTEENIGELIPVEKPDVELPEDHYEQLKDLLVKNEEQKDSFTFEAEQGTSDAEYAWPFIIDSEKGYATTSNTGKDSSYSILHAKVSLKAGEAVTFEYFASMQPTYDYFYVLVDGEDIYAISSLNKDWEKCGAYVANEDGVYDIVLLFQKDVSDGYGEDAVHIKNFEIVNKDDLDVEAYVPREAATKPNENNTDYTQYVTVVLGSDGYYHVGTEDGPILMASLLNYSNFSNEYSLSMKIYETFDDVTSAGIFMVDGVNKFDTLVQYCNYAANAKIYGYCSVTPELKDLLDEFAKQNAFIYNENAWLRLCSYYDVYGKDENGNPAEQLGDVISGLASFSAPVIDFTPVIDEENPDNNVLESESYDFSYDRVIMPRGYMYAFTPTVGGVYRFTSNSSQEVVGWIFTGSHDEWIANGDRFLYTDGDQGERYCTELLVENENGQLVRDYTNISMVALLEAGKTYYIDLAYYDVYATGSFTFNVKYLGESFDHFRAASSGVFTYEETLDGTVGDLIVGGIDVALGEDGYYHHKLEDGSLGSIVYADFHFGTNMFPSNSLKQMITNGAFNFKMTEHDNYAYTLLQNNTLDDLKEAWGTDYEYWYEFYQLDDIQNNIYHGTGEDMTDEISAYLDKLIDDPDYPELQGCVAVDKELAELLQMLIDKFSFQVEGSWTKVCYYYDSLTLGE